MFREDLEAIATAVAEIGDLQIESNDGVEADLPEDFATMPERLEYVSLTARASSAKIEVYLGPDRTFMALTEPNTTVFLVSARVREICKRRRRLTFILPGPSLASKDGSFMPTQRSRLWLYLPMGMLILAMLLAFFESTVGFNPNIPIGSTDYYIPTTHTVLYIALFVAAPLGFILSRIRAAVLINVEAKQRPSFWKRKQDDIRIAAVSLPLGGVVGWLVNELTK
ncbi:hypothetical protein GCM10022248_86230 [Nonomuraea soli]